MIDENKIQESKTRQLARILMMVITMSYPLMLVLFIQLEGVFKYIVLLIMVGAIFGTSIYGQRRGVKVPVNMLLLITLLTGVGTIGYLMTMAALTIQSTTDALVSSLIMFYAFTELIKLLYNDNVFSNWAQVWVR